MVRASGSCIGGLERGVTPRGSYGGVCNRGLGLFDF